MTSPASAIVANGIRLALGSRTVLDRVDLAVPAGQITAVVGPNGAGKSTLLRALAGQLSPIAGTISLAGRPLAEYSAQERARAIAYLPQERAVHWPLSVRAVVALGRLPHRDLSQNAGADAAAIENALRAMDAIDLADRPISDLSGGERARVLVARALAQEAPLLLADEPTAGLDPSHALTLFARFETLAAAGRSVIVALHDLSLAARFAHHVILVAHGGIAAAGPPADVLTPGHLEPAFGVKMMCATLGDMPIVVPISTLP
jgi:iron complex transport system ATP-binding protein